MLKLMIYFYNMFRMRLEISKVKLVDIERLNDYAYVTVNVAALY